MSAGDRASILQGHAAEGTMKEWQALSRDEVDDEVNDTRRI
jgi:hypothetical protein